MEFTLETLLIAASLFTLGDAQNVSGNQTSTGAAMALMDRGSMVNAGVAGALVAGALAFLM